MVGSVAVPTAQRYTAAHVARLCASAWLITASLRRPSMPSDKILGFFNDYLPNKINDDLVASVNAVFCFDLGDSGAWSLDLKSADAEARVTEGLTEGADCTIKSDAESWEKLLDSPSSAMGLFMMGKIKADNIGQATKLQKILA